MIGRHGIGNCDTNGELLLALCSEFKLLLTNTVFKQRDEHNDYIITRQRDRVDFHSTRTMREANCMTDHQLRRSKIAFALRSKRRKQGATKLAKLNTDRLYVNTQRLNIEQDMDKALTNWRVQEGMRVDQTWTSLSKVVYETASNTLGIPERKHQDWFDPEVSELLILMKKGNETHQRVLQTRSTRYTTTAFKEACRHLQMYTRKMKTNWWDKKAEHLQRSADNNDMKSFYTGLKEVWGLPDKEYSSSHVMRYRACSA